MLVLLFGLCVSGVSGASARARDGATSCTTAAAATVDIFVDPFSRSGGGGGRGGGRGGSQAVWTSTLRGAQAAVRAALSHRCTGDVTVHLAPGVHHVGDSQYPVGLLRPPIFCTCVPCLWCSTHVMLTARPH